jgi:hypothetical protein
MRSTGRGRGGVLVGMAEHTAAKAIPPTRIRTDRSREMMAMFDQKLLGFIGFCGTGYRCKEAEL